jgi:acyl-CoA dehydrogenase
VITLRSDKVDSVIEGLGEFVDRVIVPLEEANAEIFDNPRKLYDDDGRYCKEVIALMRTARMKSAEAGYYTMFCPESIGGGGLGRLQEYRAWEYLFHRYGPGRILPYQTLSHWTCGPNVLGQYLARDGQADLVAALMDGSRTLCFAMSEAEAGSDAWEMRSTATADGDLWVINGTKQWISNSPHATDVAVFCVTDDKARRSRKGGITCFLVPVSSPGFSIDSIIRLYGHVGGNESMMSFTNVEVGDDSIIGTEGDGFRLAIEGVSRGRMYNAGRCVGLARWALERTVAYARERRTFGRPISEYQAVSFMLADCALDIYTAKQISEHCARGLEGGPEAAWIKEVALSKMHSTEMCHRVYDRCMQIHGGMGLANETKLYDGWMQSRTVRIADGTTEILKRTIATRVLKGDLSF